MGWFDGRPATFIRFGIVVNTWSALLGPNPHVTTDVERPMPDRFSQFIGCVSELLYPIEASELRIVHYWLDCHRELMRDPDSWPPADQWRWHVKTLVDRYRDAFQSLKEGINRGEFRSREEDFNIFIEIGRILRGIDRAIGPAQSNDACDVLLRFERRILP